MTQTTPTGTRLDYLGDCRVCALDTMIRVDRKRSTLTDPTGPVHLCCARLPDGATSCTACRTAQALDDDWQSRGRRRSKERAEQARRIVEAP